MLAADQGRLLRREDALAYCVGISCLAQINQQIGLLRHQAQAGEGMEALVEGCQEEGLSVLGH